MAVKVGDSAPDFTLKSNKGKAVKLQSLYKRKPVVLYFYPKDDTPGCTKEACGFRDSYEVFQKLGAEVVGISSDSVDSHKEFATSNNLPFQLLSDEDDQVRKLYGVPSTLGILPGRVTYIIDKKGIVQKVFNSQLNVNGHIKTAIKTLEELQ
ncbi:Putative peroxiredoxin bcp [Acaryochloris thomasi RCC1774]|uniref:thioredoxin-dependent peroxiredoxin n=1 Tax=Acaryochloris thomasi RCC1774 TaxID=1764569 RepID=A0A2W1JB97_9CYAN|nr:peroxiredoxin [Acaryochloris thomasi]PZD71329.1 Putative peroxiredoxin bcp [Acaryochloris thomasi RCC1774]